MAISYRRFVVTKSLSSAIFDIMAPNISGSRPWPFRSRDRVTSSVTWPFDSQVVISYRCSIVIKCLSPAVSEILGAKHIGVTTLTFQGHVTSSVTWPFDSQVAIPYLRSIVIKSLSPAILEIMGTRHIGVTTWPFRVTWRHRSRDGPFPIGGPLDRSLNL